MNRQIIPPAKDIEQLRNSLQLVLDKIVQDLNQTSQVDGGGKRVSNVGQPSSKGDAVNLGYLNEQLSKLMSLINSLQQTDFVLPSVIKAILNVGGTGVFILAGYGDPSGTPASSGSLYLDGSGRLWQNIDATPSGWVEIDGANLVGETLTLDASAPSLKVKQSGTTKFEVASNGDVTAPNITLSGVASYLNGLTASRPLQLDGSKKIVTPSTVYNGTQTVITHISPTASGTIPDPIDTTGFSAEGIALGAKLNALLSALVSGGTVLVSLTDVPKNLVGTDGILTSIT